MLSGPFQPVIITVLVVLEVAVWQVRVAMAARGRKQVAAALGAVNAVLSVVAIGQVVTHLDRPANIAGYAVGVALGVYIGVVADGRLARDPVEYRVVVPGDGADIAASLRDRGWPVTDHPAYGSAGYSTVVSMVVPAGQATRAEQDLKQCAPAGFRTSTRLRSATQASITPGPIIFDRLRRSTRTAAIHERSVLRDKQPI